MMLITTKLNIQRLTCQQLYRIEIQPRISITCEIQIFRMLIVQNSVFIKKRPNSTSENDTINGERLVFSVNTNSRYLGVIFLCSKNCSSVEITSIMNVLFNQKSGENQQIFVNFLQYVVDFKRRTYYFIVVNTCESNVLMMLSVFKP